MPDAAMLYITNSESGFFFGVSKPVFSFRFVDKYVKRFKMNEVVKVVEGRGDSFLDDSKYPGKAYDRSRAFYERLYDLESEGDDEDECCKEDVLTDKV